MRYFRVTFIPEGREEKEWIMAKGMNKDEVSKNFSAGMLIKIHEVSKETHNDYVNM